MLRDAERQALAETARARFPTPANWVRSLVLVHLMRRPRWNDAELAPLHELTRDVRAVGNHLNEIARTLNVAVQSGEYPPGDTAREGAILIRHEIRRLIAIMGENYDYWGLPEDKRPTSAQEAV